jgi:molecular chaperone GrpE
MEHNINTVEQATDEADTLAHSELIPEADSGNASPEASQLASELEDARREASENYDRYLRVHAEMENYKKRIERTYADLSRNSKKDLLLKLLGVKDNLERALSYGQNGEQGENESVIQGVRLTEYQLDQLLRTEGVSPMDLKGQAFDPQLAEAVSTLVNRDLPDHSVAEIVQQGYMYQDDVLRPAKVVVAVRDGGQQL